jgi:tetratricopeptide (TPR) repeat protein
VRPAGATGISLALASALLPIALPFCPCLALADDPGRRSSTDEYVLGRDLYLSLSPDNMPAAVEHLQRAVEIDPGNLRAWYSLADAYRTGMLMVKTGGEAWKEKSRSTEDYLLRLSSDPQRAAGYEQRFLADLAARLKGTIAIDLGNWTEAEAVLQRTRSLESDSELNKGRDISFGAFLFSVGRIKEAEHFLARARVADRYAGVIYSHLARVHSSMNDYESSRAVLAEGMNLFSHSETGIEQRWHPLLRRTHLFNALATGDRDLIAASARSIKSGDLGAGDLDRKLATLLNDDQALKRMLHEAWSDPANQHGYRAESVAIWAAYARDYDLAFAAVHRLPNDLATWALWHPAMAESRSAPGFRELVQKTGLLNYWRSSGTWGEFCGPVGVRDFECKATAKTDQPLPAKVNR